MSKYIVDIHGDIEGDYEIVRKYEDQESILDKVKEVVCKWKNDNFTDGYAWDYMKEIADIIDKGESEKKIMLYEEVEKYARLSGDKNAWDTSGSRIGGYLDGYDKGIEILDRVRAEIAELSHYYPMGHDYQIAITRCLAVIDKYKPESENK